MTYQKSSTSQPRHGHSPKGRPSPEYQAFHDAKKRCQNKRSKDYPNYGERGVEFRFTSFQAFYAEVGPRPSKLHSLNRINNDGHYEPGNVEWTTKEKQNSNKRSNHQITLHGETKTMAAWTRHFGLPHSRVAMRRSYGWCDQCLFSTISGHRCRH